MRIGTALTSQEVPREGRDFLACIEQTIGLQERAVTQQRLVVEAAIAAQLDVLDTTEALALLRTMEASLTKLHAWRVRLQSLQGSPTKRVVAAAPTARKIQAFLPAATLRHRLFP
jgi:hypothetical protein